MDSCSHHSGSHLAPSLNTQLTWGKTSLPESKNLPVCDTIVSYKSLHNLICTPQATESNLKSTILEEILNLETNRIVLDYLEQSMQNPTEKLSTIREYTHIQYIYLKRFHIMFTKILRWFP